MRISDWSSDVCSSDLQSGSDPSFRIDRRCDACIRGGHHRPCGLDAAHPPDLQMLAKRPGLAEPGEVAQVHKHARAGSSAGVRQERREQLGTENILVANVERQVLIIHRERRSEEHTSELQSLMRISYAVFCLKKKTNK